MTRTPTTLPMLDAAHLDRVREAQPLVQCLTNAVVTNYTANALLALGGAPAMVDIREEAQAFAPLASAVLINLGTPHREQAEAMRAAASAAHAADTPWVLDPVAVGALPVRTELARELLEHRPTVIRGNASEIMALAGTGAGGRGVDAADEVDAALPAARELAQRTSAVVALSGPVDAFTDGTDTVRGANGHPLLTQVTGGGCALGAVIAAFVAVGNTALSATIAACTTYNVAAEQAVQRSHGPGSFAVALLDAFTTVTAVDVATAGRLS